jgi:hypothetical protein
MSSALGKQTNASPGIAPTVMENVSPATWYFAIRAYNPPEGEMSLSSLASTTAR